MIRLVVTCDDRLPRPRFEEAKGLAERLGVSFKPRLSEPGKAFDLGLAVMESHLELRVYSGEESLRGGKPVFADLTKLDVVSPQGRRWNQPLLKAVGVRRGQPRPGVLDATAGWGEDAWLLASFGCTVTAVERQPIVAAMLQDAVRRAGGEPADRLGIVHANAIEILQGLDEAKQPDVVYLDPMFPGADRKAMQRKPMRVLRLLAGEDDDAAELLEAALGAARRRVVVKRASKAKALTAGHAGRIKPVTSHRGRGHRFDVYVNMNAMTMREDTA